MDEHPEILACPYCGNINPYTQDNCMKCKKPLETIRQAMEGIAVNAKAASSQSSEDPQEEKKIEPPPPMPELPSSIERDSIGNFISSRAFLIRNMGNRADEIAARYFKQLANRNIQLSVRSNFDMI